VRALQPNSCDERQEYFFDVRKCRRRRQIPWQGTPIARLFTTPDDYALLQFRAVATKVRSACVKRGLSLVDAFRAFDRDRDGILKPAEVYAGLKWLGVDIAPNEMQDILRHIDMDGNGIVTEHDFTVALADPFKQTQQGAAGRAAAVSGRDKLSGAEDSDEDEGFGAFPTEGLPSIPSESDLSRYTSEWNRAGGSGPNLMAPALLRRLKVKLQPHTQFQLIWATEPSQAVHQMPVSIWAPDGLEGKRSTLRRNRVRICLGHYVIEGYDMQTVANAAAGAGSQGVARDPVGPMVFEFTDTGVSGLAESPILKPLVDTLLPLPVRFRQVGTDASGRAPLHLWSPVPPTNDYVALGLIATTGDSTPPPLTAIRCIPRKWTAPSPVPPRKLADLHTSGGGKVTSTAKGALSIWAVTSMQLLAAVPGGSLPRERGGEAFVELKYNKFGIEPDRLGFRVSGDLLSGGDEQRGDGDKEIPRIMKRGASKAGSTMSGILGLK